MTKKGPAEEAAEQGTVGACWDSYLEYVVRETLRLAGLPPNAAEYERGSRLDFYAGAACVFQILRAKFERGEAPSGTVMVDLEKEVALFLAEGPRQEHKAGHA